MNCNRKLNGARPRIMLNPPPPFADTLTAHRKPETSGMLRLCEELDVKVLAYSPLGQGLLTGKYSKDFVPRYK